MNNIHPGSTLTITGHGLPKGTLLSTVLHSVPTTLGSVKAGSSGGFTEHVTIPADTTLGAHHIDLTASGPTITTSTRSQAITVTAAPVVAPPDNSRLAITGNPPAAKPVPAPRTRLIPIVITARPPTPTFAPNILTHALTPLADVVFHPQKIASAIELGLVLLLLAVLPAHLLSATLAEQSERFDRQLARLRRRPRWMIRWAAWLKSAPVVGGIAVTMATAVVLGFADPTFGFTVASLRLILACAIGLFLVGYVANALTGWIARRRWNVLAEVRLRPYGLVLTIVGVLLSRLLHFSPGFLIGLILGVTVQGVAAKGYAWRLVAVRASIVLGMGIAAWIGYSTLSIGGTEGGTFGSALLIESLVAITTEGIVALAIELLPLRFLEGERLYAHSKVLWAAFYVITLVVFVVAVIPWEGNWDALGGALWAWILVLVGFSAVCVGVYVFFRRFAKPLEAEAGDEEVPLAETVVGDRS